MNGTKILIVDDHLLVRDGIKSLLREFNDIQIIGEAGDGAEALDILGDKEVDLILMDINMPNIDGIEATEKITKKYPKVKIIALSMLTEQRYIVKMLQAGAHGYVLKSTRKEELLTAINKVMDGETYFSQEVSSIMMSKYMHNGHTKELHKSGNTETLTKREKEILRLIVQEYTNGQIAEKLFLSSRTVDTHRRNILLKLDVKNTAGLVRYAFESGIMDEEVS